MFLVLPGAALGFSVMSWSVRAGELVSDTEIGGGLLKKGLDVPFTVGKAVCELKAVVGLDTFHTDASAGRTISPAVPRSQRKNRWTAPDKPPGSGAWRTRL